MHVVLSGFSVRFLCFVQAKTVCRYGCMYFFATLMLMCVRCTIIVTYMSHNLMLCILFCFSFSIIIEILCYGSK